MKRSISIPSAVLAVLLSTGISFAAGNAATPSQANAALDLPTIQLNLGIVPDAGRSQTVAVNNPAVDLPTVQLNMGVAPDWNGTQANTGTVAAATADQALDLPTIQQHLFDK